MPDTAPITVIILTYNEAKNLPACLESVYGWTAEVFVVDSGSTDETQEIAQQYGANVVEHPFETHARQWSWALNSLPIPTEWVLGLDADQRVSKELKEELIQLFDEKERLLVFDGFYIKRRQIFRGRWIRHGGYYPKYLLKLFRKDATLADGMDLIDHHFYVQGKVGRLKGDLIEENRKEDDITFWINKHNRYAQLLAKEEFLRKNHGNGWPIKPSFFGSPDQRIVRLKQLWYGLPLYVRPFLYFFYRYFVRLGFLDGKEGFIFHFMQAFWYRLLVDIVLEQMKRGVVGSGSGQKQFAEAVGSVGEGGW